MRRSVPRRLLFMIGAAVPLMVLQNIAQVITGLGPVSFGRPSAPVVILGCLGVAVAGLVTYSRLVGRVERRPVTELAPRRAPAGLAAGAVLGTGLLAATVGLLLATGQARIAAPGAAGAIPASIGIALFTGVLEELMFRGLLFRIVEELTNTWVALAVSAVLFGAVHLANPGATWWTSTAIAVQAGLFLSLVFAATRRLWVPIGLHAAWNFAQIGIFATPVSGITVPGGGLLDTTLTGNPLLTGGAFGVEAGLVALSLCLAAGVVFLGLARRTSRDPAGVDTLGARTDEVRRG